MTNPEQPVLDEIAELVDWQIKEGERRGDHLPEASEFAPSIGGRGLWQMIPSTFGDHVGIEDMDAPMCLRRGPRVRRGNGYPRICS